MSPADVFDEGTLTLGPNAFKQEALLFRGIAVPHLEHLIRAEACENHPHLRSETITHLEWLLEKDVLVFEPTVPPRPADNEDSSLRADLQAKKDLLESYLDKMHDETLQPLAQMIAKLNDRIELMKEQVANSADNEPHAKAAPLGETKASDEGTKWRDVIAGVERVFKQWTLLRSVYGQYLARIASVDFRNQGVDACPVIHSPLAPIGVRTKKEEVVEIVLEALPIPDDSVSWEQILDFRSDPESFGKFLALRDWMNEVARGSLTKSEIEDKIEYLVYQYREHMRLHNLKIQRGRVGTIIRASATILGSLVNLKLGEVGLKDLFSLRCAQITLLERELTSPGREVAYIVKAQERFLK